MIINLNGKHHLKSCLDSLQNQTYQNFDTYIIDNGSSDGSLSYIVKNYPLVKIIAFSKNLGFAGAYNQAVKEIMDRMDGKPVAIQEVTGPNGAELKNGFTLVFEEPANGNDSGS